MESFLDKIITESITLKEVEKIEEKSELLNLPRVIRCQNLEALNLLQKKFNKAQIENITILDKLVIIN